MPTRKLIVEIVGDASSFQRSLKGSEEAAAGFGRVLGGLSVGFGTFVKGVLIVDAVQKSLQGLTATVHGGIEEFKQNTTIQAQTAAALASTGGVAHVTAKQIDELGLSLSNLSGVNDEVIRQGANTLLAFTNIRNFAGKNNQVFDDALKATLDFAVRSGRGIQAAGVAIGRALQDPTKAASSLRRAYIVLTKDEKAAIATALAHGDVLKAQKDIIADVEKRYGGAAKAAGQTLSGQLEVLKERFHDLAGELVGVFAPSFGKGISGLTGFVKQLSEARTIHARLRVVFDGLTNVGRDLFNAVRAEVARVDWTKLADSLRSLAGTISRAIEADIDRVDFTGIGRRISEKLRAINWGNVVGQAGRAAGQALVVSLNTISSFISRVNWDRVGKAIIDGFALAVAAFGKFLVSINWGAVIGASFRLLNAAIRAQGRILAGAFREIGRLALNGLKAGISAGGVEVEKLAISIVLKIIEPFTHLPRRLGAGPFQAMKHSLQDTLAKMKADAAAGGAQVGSSVTSSMADAIKAGTSAVTSAGEAAAKAAAGIARSTQAATAPTGPDTLPGPPTPTAPARKGITAGQRNTFFDNRISRLLDRVQDAPLKEQIAKLRSIAALITQRIAVTRDVTRKLTLEDELLNVTRQIGQTRDQLSQQFLNALSLKVDEAGATKSVQDDLRALGNLQAAILKRIKGEGKTLDLERQLFDVQQQIVQARRQQQQNQRDLRNAAQFKAIGLTATGADVIPGTTALQRQLKTLDQAVEGTFLDTKKTRSLVAHIREVLSGGLGAVGRDVREKVKGILDGLTQQLKDHAGDQTKFRHVSSSNILAAFGLDLTPEQARRARSVLAQVGAGGTIPQPQAAFGLAGGTTIQIQNLHTTARNARDLETDLLKLQKGRPRIRRGS